MSDTFSFTDDYIAIGADCEELGAQIEEYILYVELIRSRVLFHDAPVFWVLLPSFQCLLCIIVLVI